MRILTVTAVLTLIIACAAAPAFAQGLSHGTQNLRMGYEDCLRRAENALSSEGYRIDDRSEGWRGGNKAGARAGIICNPGDNGTWANVVVAGNSFGNSLDNERERLQDRLDPRGSQGPQGPQGRPIPVSATTANLMAQWNWVATCANSTPSGRWQITNQRQGSFSGTFSNSNPTDTGSIDGVQQGQLVEFRRLIPGVGEQRWSGGVERNGGGLRMEGRIDGPGGPCTFSATTANAGNPRSPGGQTNITGSWNWTASCNGSAPFGRFEILNQRRDAISGVFSNANSADTGTIEGRQQGLLVDFRRSIPGAGEQRWTGGLAASGGVLTMEGRIEGVGGPCLFSATMGR